MRVRGTARETVAQQLQVEILAGRDRVGIEAEGRALIHSLRRREGRERQEKEKHWVEESACHGNAPFKDRAHPGTRRRSRRDASRGKLLPLIYRVLDVQPPPRT